MTSNSLSLSSSHRKKRNSTIDQKNEGPSAKSKMNSESVEDLNKIEKQKSDEKKAN
jgi:hypothetical protein